MAWYNDVGNLVTDFGKQYADGYIADKFGAPEVGDKTPEGAPTDMQNTGVPTAQGGQDAVAQNAGQSLHYFERINWTMVGALTGVAALLFTLRGRR